jgi:hypothetical protein
MELLDRYLKAVRFWLPSEQKQDIIAELSEDLHAQFEDKESELGRPLNEAEVEAILKKGGSPMLVAQRYHPQRYLIGPALFPMYWFVLKLGWLFFFGPWLILGIGVNLFAGGHFQELMEPFLRAVLINFAAITGVFALLERSHAQTGFAKNWTPRKLPAVRDPNRVPRSSSIRELTWYLMLALWWGNVLRIPAVPGVTIVMAPPAAVESTASRSPRGGRCGEPGGSRVPARDLAHWGHVCDSDLRQAFECTNRSW